MLVNAILFTASWADPLDESRTEDLVFRRVDGAEAVASGMNHTARTGYARGETFSVVELPYDGHQLSMLLVVPDVGAFDSVERSLSAAWVNDALSQLTVHDLTVGLPKFTFRSKVPVAGALRRLGMVDAFVAGDADFSGMTGDDNGLFVQDVVREAFIAADERGTEAAAATAVVVGIESLFPSATLVIDRPTGATLFVGRVMDPTH